MGLFLCDGLQVTPSVFFQNQTGTETLNGLCLGKMSGSSIRGLLVASCWPVCLLIVYPILKKSE
jgi:hypothetical protein